MHTWRSKTHGLLGTWLAAAAFVAWGALFAPGAHAQKSINYSPPSGSLNATLQFANQISPDTYWFHADAGEQIRVQTSNLASNLDTTVRVVGPDASINLFDDDSGDGFASRLVFTAADTGYYIVVVSTFSGTPLTNSSGTYTLTLARGSAALERSAEIARETAPGDVSGETNEVEVKSQPSEEAP